MTNFTRITNTSGKSQPRSEASLSERLHLFQSDRASLEAVAYLAEARDEVYAGSFGAAEDFDQALLVEGAEYIRLLAEIRDGVN
jgi:hypothetical protein